MHKIFSFLHLSLAFCAFFVFSLQKRVYNIQKQVKYRYTGWQHHRMAVLTDGSYGRWQLGFWRM